MSETLMTNPGIYLWGGFAAVSALFLVLIVLLLILLRRNAAAELAAVRLRLELVERGQERLEKLLREEMARSREESAASSRQDRDETSRTLSSFADSLLSRMAEMSGLQKNQMDSFARQLATLVQSNEQRLAAMRDTMEQRLTSLQRENAQKHDQLRAEAAAGARQQRDETAASLKNFNESVIKGMTDLGALLRGQMEGFADRMGQLTESNEKKLEAVRGSVENRLKELQEDNSRQLERMRATVDEKLQGTLEKRLGESFRHVSERLEQVHKGLGEMQTLASGVGDLKKALTNVKTRGTWGEIQLEALLEEILAPEQYDRNVKIRENSGEMVEFALRLPGREDGDGRCVWLPIDAKFPLEDYQRLLDAQDRADSDAAETAAKLLVARIKSCAKDICDKYISPPDTTDFGVMFLPTEGLYAEVIRRPGLVETVQRDYRVVVAGPTTFAALLNSLQMGFRTLAIQKRSSEVWKLLGAVKAEFGKFGDALEGVRRKLEQASNTMESAARKSRSIERKLRGVQELPPEEAQRVLEDASGDSSPSFEE